MARIRSVKPDLLRHVKLYEAECETGLPLRVAYVGLFTAADREGRFKWNPRELKLDCLPHDDVDFARVLDAWWTRGFIVKYAVNGCEYGWIPSWKRHQVINNREKASDLPEPNEENIINPLTREARVYDASSTRLVHAQGEGKGKEGEGKGKKDAADDARVTHASGTRQVAPDGAHAGVVVASTVPAPPPPTADTELFRRGKEVLGNNAGGLIKQLLKAKDGSIPLARAAIEMASTKHDPREYVGAIIRGKPDEQPYRVIV